MYPDITRPLFGAKLFILWGNFWFGLLILPATIKRTAPSRGFFLGIALVAVATSLAEGGTLCLAVHQQRHQRARENERIQALTREWAPFFAEEKTDLDPAKVEQLLTNRALRSCLAEAVAWGGRAFHDHWADSIAEDLHVPAAQEYQAYPGIGGGDERPSPALVNAFRFGRTWPELQQAAGWLWKPGRAWIRLAEDNPYLVGTPEMKRWLAQSSMPVPSPESAENATSHSAQTPSPHYTLRRRMAFDSVSGHAAAEALTRYWTDQIIAKTPSPESAFLPF